jgi:hypothetical protein
MTETSPKFVETHFPPTIPALVFPHYVDATEVVFGARDAEVTHLSLALLRNNFKVFLHSCGLGDSEFLQGSNF